MLPCCAGEELGGEGLGRKLEQHLTGRIQMRSLLVESVGVGGISGSAATCPTCHT